MTSISLFFILLLLSTTAAATTHSSDVAALKAIKAAIDPTTIPPNSCLASWNFTSDPCTPHPTHFLCGVSCSNNRVTTLVFFDSAGYAGPLSPLISQLTNLTEIALDNNKLYGPIPTSIFSLPNLLVLDLSNNSFSGTIPPVITMKTLQFLYLSHNSLSGPLPDTSSSLSLSHLDLSFNKFNGPIPKPSPSTFALTISSNNISGGLQETIFNDLMKLHSVDLSNNSLTGTIPGWLFRKPLLQQVNLSHNAFTAIEIFKPMSNKTYDLSEVDVGYNQIAGYLSTNFTSHPSWRLLSLRHNKLKGPIPKEFSQHRTMYATSLFLDGNYLNGKPSKDFFSKKSKLSGSFGDNCLKRCPKSSKLCAKSQKQTSICRKEYDGK